MESSQKNRSLLQFCIIILFIGLLAFYFLGYKSSLQKVSDQTAEIKSLTQQNAILAKKAAEKKAALAVFPQEEVQAALPLWDNIEQLTMDLNKTSQDTNVVLNNLSYMLSETNQLQVLFASETPVYPNVQELKINLVLNGKYSDIYNWIIEIQKLPRIITINGLNLEKPAIDRVTESKISANLTISAYYDPAYKALVKKVLVPFE